MAGRRDTMHDGFQKELDRIEQEIESIHESFSDLCNYYSHLCDYCMYIMDRLGSGASDSQLDAVGQTVRKLGESRDKCLDANGRWTALKEKFEDMEKSRRICVEMDPQTPNDKENEKE